MTILYFTGTGNSLYVAKSLGGELLSIPQLIATKKFNFEDDMIGIVCPLYSWSIPKYIVDFLKQCTFQTEYLFGIVTYGIFSAGVTNHLASVLTETGHEFQYVNKIKMVDNYLPGFDMEKQIDTEAKKNIEESIERIKADIDNRVYLKPAPSLIRTSLTNYMVRGASKPKKENPRKRTVKVHGPNEGIENYYYVNDKCVQCSTCVRVCPVHNIELRGENIRLGDKCIMCLSCIQNCPFNAIHLRGEVSSARYRNKNVTLAEIIQSNNQTK